MERLKKRKASSGKTARGKRIRNSCNEKYKSNKNESQYIPRHTEKYCGTYPIICRSSWEYRMCEWLDYNKKVSEWSSEGHRIPYFDPVNNRKRIYYPDYYVCFKGG
jgi:hypothetical protein